MTKEIDENEEEEESSRGPLSCLILLSLSWSLRLLPNSRLVPQAVAGALLVAAAVYLASDAAGAPAALAVAFAAADEAHEAMQPALPHWNAEVNKFSSVAGIPRALKWLTSGVL